jgi:hypothetical protein
MRHLGELESFCTRVQVAVQMQQVESAKANAVKHRQAADEKRDDREDAPDDDGNSGDKFGAQKDAVSGAASNARDAAAASSRVPVLALKISIPDIHCDDDLLFGEDCDAPVELNVLRERVQKARERRATLVTVKVRVCCDIETELQYPNRSYCPAMSRYLRAQEDFFMND